jgi:hypothetical protein
MLILPRPPRIRPPGNLSYRLNRRHRLASDAVAVILGGPPFGLGRDLVTGEPMLPNNGTPSIGYSGDGPGFTNPTNTDRIQSEVYDPIWDVTGEITVAWRGQVTSSTAYRYLFGKVPNGGNGGTNTPWCLELGNATAMRLTLVRSNGGFRSWQQNTTLVVADAPFSASVSQGADIGVAPTFYVNGVTDATTSQYGGGGSGAAGTNTHFITMGNLPSGVPSAQFYGNLAVVAARQWSAGDSQIFNEAPYGLIEEAPRYYFPTPTAPATSVEAGAGSASGSATAAATGGTRAAGVGASAGVATAAATGAARGTGAGASTGVATAASVGQAIGAGAASSAGAATAAATGIGISTGAGSAAGVASVDGSASTTSIEAGAGGASGAATAQAVGAGLGAAAGAADGIATAAAVGQALQAAVGAADGAGTAAGVGLGIYLAAGTASGSAAVAGVGRDASVAVPPAPAGRTITAPYRSRTVTAAYVCRIVTAQE